MSDTSDVASSQNNEGVARHSKEFRFREEGAELKQYVRNKLQLEATPTNHITCTCTYQGERVRTIA